MSEIWQLKKIKTIYMFLFTSCLQWIVIEFHNVNQIYPFVILVPVYIPKEVIRYITKEGRNNFIS
jgi:hypothetical protein